MSKVAEYLERTIYGTCDASIAYESDPTHTFRCGMPAAYFDPREDGDGNHLYYCADCWSKRKGEA